MLVNVLNFILKTINTLRKSLQNVSTSPCRTQVQHAASFLFCSLIFIEYKILCKKLSVTDKESFYFSKSKSFKEIRVTAIKIIVIPRKSMG